MSSGQILKTATGKMFSTYSETGNAMYNLIDDFYNSS